MLNDIKSYAIYFSRYCYCQIANVIPRNVTGHKDRARFSECSGHTVRSWLSCDRGVTKCTHSEYMYMVLTVYAGNSRAGSRYWLPVDVIRTLMCFKDCCSVFACNAYGICEYRSPVDCTDCSQ